MSVIALGMLQRTAFGACKIATSSPVKMINLAQRYKCCSALTRHTSKTYDPWYYSIERYSPNRTPNISFSIKGTLVRTFSNDEVRYMQKREPSNEHDSIASSPSDTEPQEKLGLFARFKKMYKEYWYVLVPVHCLTSVVWFGSFYYASTSGVDVIAILESFGVSEALINPVRDSSLGHIAIAYLLYKIATPARYTVTLGGTTISIKYLEQWGYIKPIPSKATLVQMYKDKKENIQEKIAEKKLDIQEKIAEKKQDFQDRKQQLTEKKNTLMSDIKSGKDTKPPVGPAASSVAENK